MKNPIKKRREKRKETNKQQYREEKERNFKKENCTLRGGEEGR